MPRAPHSQQLQLLTVAELDARLLRLRQEAKTHPLLAAVAGENETLAKLEKRRLRLAEEAAQYNACADRIGAQAETKSALAAKKEERLRAGVGMDSRELLALQNEIGTLREQIAQLEEKQLEAMEAAEENGSAQKELALLRRRAEETKSALEKDLSLALEENRRQAGEIKLRREQIYAQLDEDLRDAYENARAAGAPAVIGLYRNGQSTGGVELPSSEVARIRALDPDEIYLCEEYGCIVVPLDA